MSYVKDAFADPVRLVLTLGKLQSSPGGVRVNVLGLDLIRPGAFLSDRWQATSAVEWLCAREHEVFKAHITGRARMLVDADGVEIQYSSHNLGNQSSYIRVDGSITKLIEGIPTCRTQS